MLFFWPHLIIAFLAVRMIYWDFINYLIRKQRYRPVLHQLVWQLYNHVGRFVHRYYGIFNKVWVADIVYLIMRPLEWIFVLTLYLFDRNPENRTAQQYLAREDRNKLEIHAH
jgi:hypothetical protein